jgi:hypothetical protein
MQVQGFMSVGIIDRRRPAIIDLGLMSRLARILRVRLNHEIAMGKVSEDSFEPGKPTFLLKDSDEHCQKFGKS